MEKKRLEILVSDEIYINLKLVAIDSGLSVSALVRSLILEGSGWHGAILKERRQAMAEVLERNAGK